MVISQDDVLKQGTIDGQIITNTKLLNIRPNRGRRNSAVVHVFSLTIVELTSQRPVPITESDLSAFHSAALEGIAERGFRLGEPIKKQIAGKEAYFTQLSSAGIQLEGFSVSIIRSDKAYSFCAIFPAGGMGEFQNAIEQIISRSTFPATEASVPADDQRLEGSGQELTSHNKSMNHSGTVFISDALGLLSVFLGCAISYGIWSFVIWPWHPKNGFQYALRFSIWPTVFFSYMLADPLLSTLLGIPHYRGLGATIAGVLGCAVIFGLLFFPFGCWLASRKFPHDP